MAKSGQTREIELHPDAWKRFERAAEVVAKSPPQHRVKKPRAAKAKATPKKSTRGAK